MLEARKLCDSSREGGHRGDVGAWQLEKLGSERRSFWWECVETLAGVGKLHQGCEAVYV